MSQEDRIAHCRTRIRQEERAALCAGNDAAQRAHAELAQLYRRLEGVLVRSGGLPFQLPDAAFLDLRRSAVEPATAPRSRA